MKTAEDKKELSDKEAEVEAKDEAEAGAGCECDGHAYGS